MRVGIALGSNLGDRIANLRYALAEIKKFAASPVLVSRVYDTEPIDCPPGSSSFLNAVIEVGFDGEILSLLERLQIIERDAGRAKIRERNAPRPIDLDILYADDLTMDTSILVLPHPRWNERLFVLLPLNDIVPEKAIIGSEKTVSEYVKNQDISGIKVSKYVICQ